MAYNFDLVICKKVELFGKSRADEMIQAAHAPLLEQPPIDPELAKFYEKGNIERYNDELVGQYLAYVNHRVIQTKLGHLR